MSSNVGLHRAYFVVLLIGLISGCASYRTPGAAVSLASLTNVDDDIAERYQREPAAPFPARMAVARIQAPGYRSYNAEGYGYGNYSVVTTRDLEQESDLQRLAALPQVADVATLNQLIIPPKLESDKELRLAAASLKADLLFMFTVNTRFRVDEYDYGPLRLISLGMIPTKDARVTATASAALIDVRTGFVYGLAEGTAQENQIASSWTRSDAIDRARVQAEREAFAKLLNEFEKMWTGVTAEFATRKTADPGSNQTIAQVPSSE